MSKLTTVAFAFCLVLAPVARSDDHPYAMGLSCADSRVPPEIVLDESLGKLFVVRVVGNVAHGDELASLENAAAHLGARFLLVLGHSSCGAVKAATGSEDETPNGLDSCRTRVGVFRWF